MKRFMKYLMFLMFLMFALTGCAPAVTRTATVDPLAAVANAEQQSTYYGGMLTQTAEAPIIQMQMAEAQLKINQQYWTATAQMVGTQTAVPLTSTAQSWTPTPAPTSTPDMHATATAARLVNEMNISKLEVDRANNTNMLYAAAPYIVGLAVLSVAVMAGIALAMRLSKIAMPVDQRGNPQPMFDVIDGKATDIFTARVQIMPQIAARLPKTLSAPAETPDSGLFPRPAWNLVENWEGRGIPYYTARGLEEIDLELHPHLASLGMTRSGKSRRFLRPTIAALLASGNRVVIIGKSTDYWVFEDHPNATLIKVSNITMPEQALRYARFLEAMVGEMNRRDDVLTSLHTSTWTRAGRARTFIALDEFGNALRQMGDVSPQARMWVESLVAEGAKNGLNILLANQRATGMASILSQMGKAIFRVEPDEEKAHKSLIGASQLQDGYFFAKFGASRLAGAFEPSDDDLIAFLKSRPVQPLDREDWIEGRFIEPTKDNGRLTVDDLPLIVPAEDQPRDEIAEMAERIRAQWDATMSGSAVARLLGFTQYGGSMKAKVDRIVAHLTLRQAQGNASTTTTTKAAEMPVLRAVEA